MSKTVIPPVSVVIPCHNYGHFLKQTVESVLAQTLPAMEILIVDDGSTDETQDVIKGFGNQVKSMSVKGRGAYGARNDSLPFLSGSYFLNVDADNILHPQFIEKTAAVLTQAPPHVGYVYTQRKYMGDQEGVSSFPAFSRDRLLRQGFVDMGSLIRMDLVKRFGFNERFNRGQGDRAFFLMLLKHGVEGVLYPQPLLNYRVHPHSITHRVRARCDQVRLQKMLLREFPDLFSPSLRKELLADAQNRLLVSLITNRSPKDPLLRRARDAVLFTRYGLRHAEWKAQLRHLFSPGVAGQ